MIQSWLFCLHHLDITSDINILHHGKSMFSCAQSFRIKQLALAQGKINALQTDYTNQYAFKCNAVNLTEFFVV